MMPRMVRLSRFFKRRMLVISLLVNEKVMK